MNLHTGE